MKKSASTISAEGLRNWQDVIDQHPQDRAITPAARRNQLVRWAAAGTSIFAGALLLLLCFWALRASPARSGQVEPSPLNPPLQKLVFASDGVLTEGWVWQFLGIHQGDYMRNIDIFALRQKLLDLKQVKDASITREFPGTLRITVQERRPWLRVAADNGAGGFQLNLVARDGTVFVGQDYTDEVLNQLPWLAGMPLHRTKPEGFAALRGMDAVAELLSTARAKMPQVAAQWTVVDLSQFDPRPETPVSLIKIRSAQLGELTFIANNPARNFDIQIQQLAVAVKEIDQKSLLVRGLDLSIDNQVVVEKAVLPTSAPAHQVR